MKNARPAVKARAGSEAEIALVAIAKLLAPLVAEQLRATTAPTENGETFSRSNLPPGTSARAFRERCKRIPEAYKDAGGHSYCPRAAWFADRRAKRPALAVVPPAPESTPDVDAMIEASGLRPTRKAG